MFFLHNLDHVYFLSTRYLFSECEMSAAFSSVWQLPYVNVFKHLKLDHQDWTKASKEGDVTHRMDKVIKCSVFKISGSVPASNFILIPKKNTPSISLTGTYFYLQFKPLPTKYFVFHIEVVTRDDLVIRISVSNLFKEFKCTSTWIQFPYAYPAPANSVEAVTAPGNQSGNHHQHHPAPPNSRWTLLCLNLKDMLSKYVQRQYSHVKTIQLCSSMLVRNVFTSDTDYDPEISFREAQKLAGLHKVSPIPREMAFPVTKNETWNELYCHVRLPSLASTPFETRHHEEIMKNSSINKRVGELSSGACRRKNMLDSIPLKLNQEANKARNIPPNMMGGGDAVELVAKKPVVAKECVHIYPNLESPRSKERSHVGADIATEASLVSDYRSSNSMGSRQQSRSEFKTSLKPDPIAQLSRVIGANSHEYPNSVCWAANDSNLVYSSSAVVVCVDVSTDLQRFFVGHTESVTCLDVNSNSTVLASAQSGMHSMVRLWKFNNAQLITVFRAPEAELGSLEFSSDSSLLCGTGNDSHGKSVICLWDVSSVTKNYDAPLIAKAHADVDIVALKLNYFTSTKMVSCGRENIRFWRLKQRSLRSCPVVLGDYTSQNFTDIAYMYSFSKTNENEEPKSVLCCTSSGYVFEIDVEGVAVRAIRRLVDSSIQEKAVNLNSLYVTSQYCVIGSRDGFLRVWSLDFASVLLEYEHSSEVILAKPNRKGDKVCSVTVSNQIGVLNIVTREFIAFQSYPKKYITSCDVSNEKLIAVTAALDQQINVWDLHTGNLTHNFHSTSDAPLIVAFHPSYDWIICGFESGALRVLDMQTAHFIHEFPDALKGQVTGLVVRHCGRQFLASCSLGILGSFAIDPKFAIQRLLPSSLPKGKIKKQTLSLSKDGLRCVYIGPSEYIVSVIDSKTLDDLMRIDITQLSLEYLNRGVIEKGVTVKFSETHILLVTTSGNLYFLDLASGKRLNMINVHKESCNALAVGGNDEYFFTSGEKVLKVWDYKLRFDVNFQMLMGHIDEVNSIHFVRKLNTIISVGDHLCMWRLRDSSPLMSESENKISHRVEKLPSKVANINDEFKVQSKDMMRLDADHTSETVSNLLTKSSENKPRKFAPEPVPAPPDLSSIAGHNDSIVSELEILNISDNELNTNDKTPPKRKVAERENSIRNGEVLVVSEIAKRSNETQKSKAPTCFNHFRRKEKVSKVAAVHYSAPENQAGLKLKSLIAFNGNARDNILWRTEPGLVYYTSGISIVIEDLASNEQRILKGHVSEISTLAIQPSGQLLASAAGESEEIPCQIIVWDLTTSTCHKVIPCANREIIAMKYSNDGRFLVSLSDFTDKCVYVWNSLSMNLLLSSKLDFVANSVAWDCDSPLEFCIVGSDCSVSFWILEESADTDGDCEAEYSLSYHHSEVPTEVAKHRRDSRSVKDGHAFVSLCYAGLSILYIGSDQGVVAAWDTRSNKCYMHWIAGQAEITHISALGSRLITGSVDHKLKLWTVMTSNSNQPTRISSESSRVPGNGLIMEDEYTLSGEITGASFDDNLELGLVGTSDCLIWYINWLERNTVRLVSANNSDITCTKFCGHESIAVGCSDGGVKLFSTTDNELLVHFKTRKPVSCLEYFELSSKREVNKLIVAGFSDGSVTVFDVNKSEVLKTITVHTETVNRISISAGKNFILSASESGAAALIDSSSFVISRMLSDHKGSPISDISFSPFITGDKEYFAIASFDRRISIWQSSWNKERCVLCDWVTFSGPSFEGQNMKKLPTVVEFSRSEKDIVLYSGYLSCKAIRFYSMRERRVLREIEIDSHPTFITLSPKGNLICMGTDSWLLKLVDYLEGSFQDFLIHSQRVSAANFGEDNSMLVSCAGNEIVIWKVSL